MGRIEDLATRYQNHISAPWQKNLAGAQRTIFIVYDKTDERKLRAKLDLFEMATKQAGHNWLLFDLTPIFAKWMAEMEYREAYFEEPADLAMKLQGDFVKFVTDHLRRVLLDAQVNDTTVVAVNGVASIFGFTKVSLILKEIEHDVKGRFVLFFPGEFENNNYRLLDARDGWNYLAVPITLHGEVNNQ